MEAVMQRTRQWLLRAGILAAVCAILTLTAACGEPHEIALSERDHNTQLEIERGQTLAITLASNASTGYSWALEQDTQGTVLVQVGEAERGIRLNGLCPESTETLRFRAAQPGRVTLKLVYIRTWEENAEPAWSYRLDVTVR
jgi:inhibitor of cysteine peptidase